MYSYPIVQKFLDTQMFVIVFCNSCLFVLSLISVPPPSGFYLFCFFGDQFFSFFCLDYVSLQTISFVFHNLLLLSFLLISGLFKLIFSTFRGITVLLFTIFAHLFLVFISL